MFGSIDTKNSREVEQQVREIYLRLYEDADPEFVGQAFDWARQCFFGEYANYQPIDAGYHDLEHTLQGTLCLTQLMQGWHRTGFKPDLTRRMFELGLLAILFHDTGYLKKEGDTEGTGAKYTLIHVDRSALFARNFLKKQGYEERDLVAVQNMISCTGVSADLEKIPFQCEDEKLVGFALATADLLGQMAASDYVDKLPVLYLEFAEAADFEKGRDSRFARFGSAEDLKANTPAFWEEYVMPKIQKDFRGLYRLLNDPCPDGPNPYLDRVKANIARLQH